jgi:adenylate cyclase
METDIREAKLVLLTADLAGYAKACIRLEAIAIGHFLDGWYRQCGEEITPRGGRIVKFIGDAVLATFPEERVLDAVDAAAELRERLKTVRAGWKIDLGANVHLAVVAEGNYGPPDDRRYDVLGSGVNHLFLMGGGPGIRISEPVYRQLPNERRGVWSKQRPPATYSLDR